MIEYAKENGKNYPRKYFWTKENFRKLRLNLTPVGANQPSNNWANEPINAASRRVPY